MRTSISACVIACNDESTIRRCLDSFAWADERIVVVDSRSSDGTADICRELGVRVVDHPYEGNVEQKNVALGLATGEWVLAFDADEALSEPLSRALEGILSKAPMDLAGIELNRITYHLGRWIRYGDFYPDWQLRVVRRDGARWAGANPHGRLRPRGRVERLEGDLEHYSYRDLADQVARIQEFSDIEADRLFDEGRRAGWSDLILRPPARFLRAYVLKAGFRDGLPGFVIAVLTGFHVFLKYAKLWERSRFRERATR